MACEGEVTGDQPWSALILAGSRGATDPVAEAAGVGEKALAHVGGATMLSRVVAAVRAAGAARIAVAASSETVAAEARRLGVEAIAAAAGPSRSAEAGFRALGTPLLITTADHALLQARWIGDFLADVAPATDVAVLLAERKEVERALPETRRTYLRFSDGHWTGCNLFFLQSARAGAVFDIWTSVERDRKRPWRIVARIGPMLLLRYLLGRLSLAGALGHLGRSAGLTAQAVRAQDALASVDVDRPADLALAERLLSRG